MEKCELPLRVKKALNKYFETVMQLREKELIHKFHYQMELARGELFEEFLDEKRERELQQECALKILKENHCRALKRLRVCYEAEHVQNLTALEMWFKEQSRIRADETVTVKPVMSNQDEAVLLYETQIQEINEKLSEKRKELLVFQKRLKYVLNGYIDFVESVMPKFQPGLLEKQLIQAKLLMTRVNKIGMKANREHFENQSVACMKIKQQKNKIKVSNNKKNHGKWF